MKKTAILLACIIAVPVQAAAQTPAPPSEPQFKTVADLYASCSRNEQACASFMDETYDWMLANVAKVGRLCDPCTTHECTHNGARTLRTAGDLLGTSYVGMINRRPFEITPAISPRDTAISSIQGFLQCHVGRLVSPGEPGFPSPPQLSRRYLKGHP